MPPSGRRIALIVRILDGDPSSEVPAKRAAAFGSSSTHKPPDCSALGGPRIFPQTRFVFCVISQRARGLMIGVDLCPSKTCNFRCVYCEVDRSQAGTESQANLEVMSAELQMVLDLAFNNQLCRISGLEHVPPEWLQLKEVALAGDGEPTLCPNFAEIVQAVVLVRAQGQYPFFKIVLITNGTGLNLPEVQKGLAKFNSRDEIWIKLDAGTQAFMHKINRTKIQLPRILDNILRLGRERPVVIQSLFPRLHDAEPPECEITAYIEQLLRLRDQGAQISQVQIFSTRKISEVNGCRHLPLRSLSHIARRVHEETGLTVDVF